MKILNWFKRKKKTVVDFGAGLNLTDLPIATFYQGEVKLNFLLDTGSNNSLINKSVLSSLKCQNTGMMSELFGMDGIKRKVPFYNIEIEYQGSRYMSLYMVSDLDASFSAIKQETGVTIHGILGNNFFKENESILDFKEFKAYFNR